MARGATSSSARGRAGRGSGRGTTTKATAERGRGASSRAAEAHEDATENDALVAAALIGAAVGAGIGLLLSRLFEGEQTTGVLIQRAGRQALRDGRARASNVSDRLGERVGGAREAFDDLVEREVKALRKAARRQRRRFGI